MAAGFLGTGAVDAYGLHRCPHHDGLPAEAAPASGHVHAGEGHADQSAAEDHADHGPCTCVGACGLTSAVLPVPRPATSAAIAERNATEPRQPATDQPALHTAYLLPFANAPPSVR